MPIIEFLVRLLETDYFFDSAIEQDYFSQNLSKIFFSKKKTQAPPPLNIKWTVPKMKAFEMCTKNIVNN